MKTIVAQIGAHVRLLGCAALGIGLGIAWPGDVADLQRFVLGWDVFAATYLVSTLWAIRGASAEARLERALATDDGAVAMMLLAIGSAVASIAAIVALMAQVAAHAEAGTSPHLGLAFATLILGWALVHTVFALHYAHLYAIDRSERAGEPDAGGLTFPGDSAPDYADFFYFSFVIGVAAQTADVAITSRRLRRLALLHGVLSFWFNTTILALALNAAAAAF